ncbi:hypothetical protein LG660_01525 [Coxiella-like endosymbiont]|nr:hypothetical protein LG660_01525 [Coxiella-like endosymbiont]
MFPNPIIRIVLAKKIYRAWNTMMTYYS